MSLACRLLPGTRPIFVGALRALRRVGILAWRVAIRNWHEARLMAVLHTLFHERTTEAPIPALLVAEAFVTLAQGARCDAIISIQLHERWLCINTRRLGW